MATETKTFYPGAHEDATNVYDSEGLAKPVGNGSSNSTYARIGSRWNKAVVYWPFDVSSIPVDATIDNVTCTAKGNLSSSRASGSMQLYSGTTAKGSAVSVSTIVTTATITGGAWTRAELTSVRLNTSIDADSSTTLYFNFYGADLIVQYTYQGQKFMLKLSGSYHDIARVFQKINGIWIEQDDLNNVVVSENGLVNGGEIESAGPVNPSFTIGGNIYYFEDGMTWEEWVDSSYNTLGLYVGNHIFHGPLVFYDDGAAAIVDATETYVNPTWLIAENHAYSLYYL